MIIPIKTVNSWKVLYEHGDIEKIHEKSIEWKTPVSAKTIGDVIRKKKGNETSIEVIGRFYKEKKAAQVLVMEKVTVEDDGN